MRDAFPFDAFPCWLEDETLFSLVSRYHRLSGHPSPKHTAKILFGSSKSGYQHDLPSGIDSFVTNTRGLRGSSGEIINRRTILPFFLAFRNERDERNAHAAMRGSRIGSLKYQLGLLTSRFRAHHPLRACAQCMLEDIELHETPYWHRSHQFPGVLICLKHKFPLALSTIKTTGVRRFDYLLPESHELAGLPNPDHELKNGQIDLMMALAECSQLVGSLERAARINPKRFQTACSDSLHELGLLTETGRIRLTQAAESYYSFLSPLVGFDDLSGIPRSPHQAMAEVGKMIRGPRSGTHPLRYLTIILWLFGNWSSFLKKMSSACPKDGSNDGGAVGYVEASPGGDPRRCQLLQLILEDEVSVTTAAQRVGVDIARAIGWASELGVEITRRSKRVKGKLLAAIIDDIAKGKVRARIAADRAVSISTVARVTFATPGLSVKWERSRFDHELNARRSKWLNLTKSHGHVGKKMLRSMSPKTYAWLYKNDLAWLQRSLSQVPAIAIGNNSKTDWLKRDSELASLVAKAAMAIRADGSIKTITFGMLCQSIPELKPRLSQLKKLPMTRRALDVAIRKGGQPSHNASIPFGE